MKKIVNNIIPFEGYAAMTVWPFIFIREGVKFTKTLERHETTHGKQQLEMYGVGILITLVLLLCGCGWWSLFALPLFYWWYVIEWLIKCLIYLNGKTAYRNISFEREAKGNENKATYNDNRKPFAWVKYIIG